MRAADLAEAIAILTLLAQLYPQAQPDAYHGPNCAGCLSVRARKWLKETRRDQ